MKKYVLIAMGLLAAAVAQAAEERVFALASAGDVDAALVERVRANLEESSGAAGREFAARFHSPETVLDAYARIYDRLLARR